MSPTWSWSGSSPSPPPCWVPEEDGDTDEDRDRDEDGSSFLSYCRLLGAAWGRAHPCPAQALSPTMTGQGVQTEPPIALLLPLLPHGVFKFSPLCTACVQGRLIPSAQRLAASPRSPSLHPSAKAPAPGDASAKAGAEHRWGQEPSAALSSKCSSSCTVDDAQMSLSRPAQHLPPMPGLQANPAQTSLLLETVQIQSF